MIQEIYFWCSKKFEDRVTIKKLVLENCGENDEVPIGKNTMNLLTIMRTTSGSCKRRIENVNRINKTGSVSSKSELDQFHLVDLLERKCSCLGFQRLGVPCAHAISLCSYLGLDATKFIHPLLTIKADLTAYTKSEPFSAFSTVGIEEDDLKPPSSCRRPRGRPKEKRKLGMMDHFSESITSSKKRKRVCPRCGEEGHFQKKCKNNLTTDRILVLRNGE
eukprot:c19622_g2_i1.p1 GENE.c19622_g2_i1~~c19622_g2_i1.p1  ORF type:complete len:219 (-),score=72.75 c19622_g2_i1:7-663(-)